MRVILGKKEFALIEQVTNSLWSFLAIRMVYSQNELREIALVGITIIFAYSCSGLLRSRFVYPLYEDFADTHEGKKYNFMPILKAVVPKYFIAFTLVFSIYFEFNDGITDRLRFELAALMCSIVLLDFQRSFLQLNSKYFLAISTNILSICLLLILAGINSAAEVSSIGVQTLDLWIVSNLSASGFIISISKRNNMGSALSPLADITKNFKKIRNISTIESFSSRGLQLIGTAILLRISEQEAAHLTVGLFIYSTIPFSILNGLSPYYLRNRRIVEGNLSFSKYFSLICFGMSIFPCLSLISPKSLDFIFGSNFQIPQLVVLFVLLMVIQKTHESAKSLDFMIGTSPKWYMLTKLIITVNLYLIGPILLGMGFALLANLILLVVTLSQIIVMKGRKC